MLGSSLSIRHTLGPFRASVDKHAPVRLTIDSSCHFLSLMIAVGGLSLLRVVPGQVVLCYIRKQVEFEKLYGNLLL